MPPASSSFTVQHNGLVRVLQTKVVISVAFEPANTAQFPPAKEYVAIWDTGATATVITRKVAEECNLKPISMAVVHTAAGQKTSPVYIINVGLPNKVGFTHVHVTEGIIADNVDVLIGMDIISQGDFVITNKDNKTTFSFRCPSIERIDFVKQAKEAQPYNASAKVGRNDPCPCGSGKKYKKCHGT